MKNEQADTGLNQDGGGESILGIHIIIDEDDPDVEVDRTVRPTIVNLAEIRAIENGEYRIITREEPAKDE